MNKVSRDDVMKLLIIRHRTIEPSGPGADGYISSHELIILIPDSTLLKDRAVGRGWISC